MNGHRLWTGVIHWDSTGECPLDGERRVGTESFAKVAMTPAEFGTNAALCANLPIFRAGDREALYCKNERSCQPRELLGGSGEPRERELHHCRKGSLRSQPIGQRITEIVHRAVRRRCGLNGGPNGPLGNQPNDWLAQVINAASGASALLDTTRCKRGGALRLGSAERLHGWQLQRLQYLLPYQQ